MIVSLEVRFWRAIVTFRTLQDNDRIGSFASLLHVMGHERMPARYQGRGHGSGSPLAHKERELPLNRCSSCAGQSNESASTKNAIL